MRYICLLLLISSSVLAKQAAGIEERVKFPDYDITLDAKLDTGATMSSLDATQIIIKNTDAGDIVTFKIPVKYGDKIKLVAVEKALKKYTRIKIRHLESKAAEQEYIRRPVVDLQICLGGTMITTEFNLVNRRKFAHRVLLGLRTLQQLNFLIDVEAHHLLKLDCPTDATAKS